MFTGVIIEESLKDVTVLREITIVSTKAEHVTEKHQTPWLKKWTLHTVEIPEIQADAVAEKIGRALDDRDNWYADFKNEKLHYVIFRSKVFCIHRNNKAEYEPAVEYGLARGIPDYQLDFSPQIRAWEREFGAV